MQSLIATGTKVWLDGIDPDEIARNRSWGITGATSNPIIIADLIKTGRFDKDIARFLSKGMTDEDLAWAMTDPRFKQEIDSLGSEALYGDRAARVGELVMKLPFDATELYRSNADFRGLLEFVQKHAPAAPAVAKAASG